MSLLQNAVRCGVAGVLALSAPLAGASLVSYSTILSGAAEAPPNERPTRIRDEIRSQKKPLVRPSASAKAATSEKDQAGRSVETRRQKSTTGRTRSAI